MQTQVKVLKEKTCTHKDAAFYKELTRGNERLEARVKGINGDLAAEEMAKMKTAVKEKDAELAVLRAHPPADDLTAAEERIAKLKVANTLLKQSLVDKDAELTEMRANMVIGDDVEMKEDLKKTKADLKVANDQLAQVALQHVLDETANVDMDVTADADVAADVVMVVAALDSLSCHEEFTQETQGGQNTHPWTQKRTSLCASGAQAGAQPEHHIRVQRADLGQLRHAQEKVDSTRHARNFIQ